MAKFELSKSVEGVKVNKRSGIPTTERISLAFGAIIEDPRVERDSLRFVHLQELVDVKLSEIEGYYKPIAKSGVSAPAASVATPETPAPAAEPAAAPEPADPRFVRWETIPSNLTTRRTKVPGGWLVAAGNGLAFVPDASHEWDGSSL